MLQKRFKTQHKTLAYGLINLADTVRGPNSGNDPPGLSDGGMVKIQAGRTDIQLSLRVSGKSNENRPNFAFIYGSVASYPEDVETVEDALEWEDILAAPEMWSDVEEDSREDARSVHRAKRDSGRCLINFPQYRHGLEQRELHRNGERTRVRQEQESPF